MLTFEQLDAIRAVVRSGGFSRAAEDLFLTQPALSQRVRHLEQAVGKELFTHRKGKRVELTPEGQTVLQFAETIASLLEGLRTELRGDDSSVVKQTIRI